ncbi:MULTISPECIES: hypothetical protein [unclassified Bradyrhizobium]|uniref:hypothetical protein n=1 Tax=unclassified Bradyrhizobium TaxID=2631580 RepID=UPI0028EBB79C|nr:MULTISPECIES: hypothetical protein [unclassified Bradyrhizobium]
MAKRRTQKVVRGYKSGGAIRDDGPLPGFGRELEEPVAAAKAPAASDSTDAIRAAIEGQRRAEALHADAMLRSATQQPEPAPQVMTLEEQVAAQPWSDRRKRFVLEHRDILLAPQNAEAVQDYMRMAKRRGIVDEEEFDRFVVSGVRFEQSARDHHLEEARAAAASPAPPLARQEAFRSPPMPAATSAAMPVAEVEVPRRSMPMAAPVQREVPTMSGKPASGSGQMHLTEEERIMARAAIPDRPDMPKLTDAQKEFLYAKNKQKYHRMVADGTYDQQRQR